MSAAEATTLHTPKYRIGTVAHLTGLSADAIRAWERRHRVVRPARTEGGTRLYSEEDVGRLQLMKGLTDCGESIGAIAQLSTEELRERLARLAGIAANGARSGEAAAPESRRVRVLLIDSFLARQVDANAGQLGNLEIVHRTDEIDQLLCEGGAPRCDVLVAHMDGLGRDPVRGLEAALSASGARMAIVLYDFAPRRRLAQLSQRGARLVKAPISVDLLRRTVLDYLMVREAQIARGDEPGPSVPAPIPISDAIPARRFSDEVLARLRETHSSVECECPNHLSDLVLSLVAFERYAERCAIQSPEDASFHRELQRGTARARSTVEGLLARLCEHDGIRL